MAIDKAHAKELIDGVNATFDAAARGLPESARRWLRDRLLGSAIGEIEKLVTQSRPPVLYLMGRSGHGKSSLLNALAGREVAKVGHIKPETSDAVAYQIFFEEVFAEWSVIDSRGIFETPTAAGAAGVDPVTQVIRDVTQYRPDVILHVITASEARTLAPDFQAVERIQHALRKETGASAPVLMVLNKVDVLGDPREWPPESHPVKAGSIKQLLDYVVEDVLGAEKTAERLNPNLSIRGFRLGAGGYTGVIPVSVRAGAEWNLEALTVFVGAELPASAILDFAQGAQRREQLRRISTSVTRRFSTTASAIGAAPMPIADIAVLTPLQLLLVAFIGGLSCRRMSLDTAREFMQAAGTTTAIGFGAREGVRLTVRFVPALGSAISGAMAGAATYGIGKAAEAYFFAGEQRRPARFLLEWRRSARRSPPEPFRSE